MEPIQIELIQQARDWFDYVEIISVVMLAVVTTVIGVWILLITKRIEHSQWRNQKLIEKRIAVWDELGSEVNDVYCYCSRVGKWKEMTPLDVISLKRKIDRVVHVNRPFFSEGFFFAYLNFMENCFDINQGHGIDAKIKSRMERYQGVSNGWKKQWESMFSEVPTEKCVLIKSYDELIEALSIELNDNN